MGDARQQDLDREPGGSFNSPIITFKGSVSGAPRNPGNCSRNAEGANGLRGENDVTSSLSSTVRVYRDTRQGGQTIGEVSRAVQLGD